MDGMAVIVGLMFFDNLYSTNIDLLSCSFVICFTKWEWAIIESPVSIFFFF